MTSNQANPVFLLVGSFALSMIKFRQDLMTEIMEREFQVHASVPIPAEDHWIAEEFRSMGVIVHESPIARTGMNPFRDIRYFLHLCGLMLRIRPSHVLSYTIKPTIYGSLASWLVRVPNRFVLVTGRGYVFESGSQMFKMRNLAQLLYKISLRKIGTVFFQNNDDEALFKSLGIVPAGCRTTVVNGSGVRLDDYPETPIPSDVSFLLIARLLAAKGIREFVAASRIVKERKSEVAFTVVGWVDDNPDAISESELREWQSEGVVNFLGKQTDVRPSIAASSVYVLPSYCEGTPRTVLEAMSMGRPVITTDAPGCRETVRDGENGFLVPVKSVNELARAMLRFVEEPKLIESMGRRSRVIAEEKYDVHKINASMLEVMGIARAAT